MLVKICLVCGKEFVKDENVSVASWFGNKRRPLGVRFCSKICSNIYKIGKSNTSSTKFKKGLIPYNKGTKGLMKPNSGSFQKGHHAWIKGKKLSPEHYKKLEDAGFFKPKFGEKSGNWKGGRTPLGAAIRTMSEYQNWRTKVFQRDKYICQCCKHNCRQLQAHHLIPFYQILDQYNIKTLENARACQLLWDISNGQTLCIPCHKQTDSYLVNQYTK